MPCPLIEICRVDDVVEKVRSGDFDLVISAQDKNVRYPFDSGAAPVLQNIFPGQGWEDRQLIVSMWDFEGAACCATKKPCARFLPLVIVGPGPKPAHDVLNFVHNRCEQSDRPLRILFHCHAGKSRSTALALGVLRSFLGDGSEQECISRLLAVRPLAGPNITLIGHFDRILHCNGALITAVRDNEVMTANHKKSDAGRMMGVARAFSELISPVRRQKFRHSGLLTSASLA